ncbi:hypothetical protein ORV05_10210 [Amycolatopsis cynarae]|uniref:VWFA domain-containing protein n=1 Tax=Amycolatopsis cynarae TaxID=2995223 RepID=A0ABY7B823_9PSEU|nr:VWA domain-containing protein [Amycolatopsis sp. HUAS 11-8]WAL68112.1 hypothetical protein ORV05_10210 [Amycolatopsis sp. HUAS 11-8]
MSARESGFTVSVSQNKYLARNDREVEAVITVTASGLGGGPGAAGAAPKAAEIIIVDCSGSMDMPRAKIIAARRATRAAIDALRDGVLFAVVAGTGYAELAYPPEPGLVPASPVTKEDAKLVVDRLVANGGTAMGTWLTLAGRLFEPHPDAVRHAMLFTDGRNEHETPEELGRVLDEVRGRFVCDVRGIGDQWEPRELLRIVAALNGEAGGVAEFGDMTAEFRELMRTAMRKVVPDVDLRLRTLGGARLRYLKQVFPSVVDLTGQLAREDELTVKLATGAWADETREYQLCLEVDPTGKPFEQDTLAARVSLDVRGAGGRISVPPELVLAHWTDDVLLVTQLDPKVTHYTGQQRLGDAVRDGCAAADAGERETAEEQLGLAVRLATESGNRKMLELLAGLVDIVDAGRGEVRLRGDFRLGELKRLDVTANRSSRFPGRRPKVATVAGGPVRECPECAWGNVPDANVCERCGHRLEPVGERS